MYIIGGVKIEADNVIIRRNKIEGGLYGVHCFSGENILIEDNTIVHGGGRKGIRANNAVIRRNDISDYVDGIWCDSNVVIEDNYIHDLYGFDSPTSHSDGIQSSGGANYVIRHNTIGGGM